MQVNKIYNITNFRENTQKVKTADSQNAILMLRDPNATIKFQQNQEFAQNADSVDKNPLKALGYKLYRTFSMIRNNEQNPQEKQLNAIA